MVHIINIEEIPTRHEPWYYKENDKEWSFESYSPAGENLIIEGDWSWFGDDRLNGLARYLRGIYADFDPDEHASGWYGANRGEPDSLRKLVDDANAIDDMYEDLADFITQLSKGLVPDQEQPREVPSWSDCVLEIIDEDGRSIAEIARAIGMDVSNLHNLLKHRQGALKNRLPNIETVCIIASELGYHLAFVPDDGCGEPRTFFDARTKED